MGKMTLTAQPGKHDIVLTREFDAPPELVFRAMVEPELVARWWGYEPLITTVEQMDVRPGGAWRYTLSGEGFDPESHYGYFHTIEAPTTLVYTYEFSGVPGHVGLITTTLEARDGRTWLTEQSLFPSVEDRDGIVGSGMEEGAAASWDRLETVAQSLVVTA